MRANSSDVYKRQSVEDGFRSLFLDATIHVGTPYDGTNPY